MRTPVKRSLTFAALGGLLILVFAGLARAQGSLEILPLRYRTAEQVIPVLRPLLKPGGRLLAVVGEAPVMEALLVTCAGGASYSKLALFETCIPALRNAPQPARFVF